MKLREFRRTFGREPSGDDLDTFVEEWTLEMYNAGWDEWSEYLREPEDPPED
jgi:hypothetical protein